MAFTNPLRKILNRFEKDLKTRAVGYSVPVERVDVYKKVTQEGLAVFVPDTSTVAAQVVPEQIKRLVKPLLTFLGRPPGIFAPLVFEGKIKGMLNIVGPNISEKDIPAMQAFANQIAVALENARLVSNLRSAREELEIAYQQTLEGWVEALDLRDNETVGHTSARQKRPFAWHVSWASRRFTSRIFTAERCFTTSGRWRSPTAFFRNPDRFQNLSGK